MREEFYEIYLIDLKEEAQRDLMDFLGVESPEDINAETFPIAIIPRVEEE